MKNLFQLMALVFIIFSFSCEKEEPISTTNNGNNGNNNGNNSITKSSAKDITKFSFAALSPVVDATIDIANKTISATLPSSSDLTKLVPTITVSEKATISPATGVAQDFSTEVSYTVTAEDGSTAVWKVNVKKEVVTANNNLIVNVKNSGALWQLQGLSLFDGKEIWNYTANSEITSSPSIIEENVFIQTFDKKIHCINIKNGLENWSFSINAQGNSIPFGSKEQVFWGDGFNNTNVNIYAIDSKTGKKNWEFPISSGLNSYSNLTFEDGKLFVQNNGANYSDKILALDASTGKLLWERSLPVRGNMAVSKNTLFFGSTRGLFALNAKDGSIKWENTETTIAYPNNSSPTLSEVDKSVIFSSQKGLFCIDIETGKTNWKNSFSNINLENTCPIARNGKVFISLNEFVYAINIKTGDIEWSNKIEKDGYGTNINIVVTNDKIFFRPKSYRFIYAISISDGKTISTIPLDYSIIDFALFIDGAAYHSGLSGMVQ